jgi:L-fuculose-phosphate aldolase
MQLEVNQEYAIDGTTEPDLFRNVAEAYRELGQQGLISGRSGNVSLRVGDRMLITATGTSWDSVTPHSIVSMGLDGRSCTPGRPSCEWQMHAEIYRRKPEAVAIAHTHSDACIALSSLRRAIPAFHYMVAAFGGSDVPCTPYAPFGTHELACSAADALAGRTACLLANHGAVCHSSSLSGTVLAALALETLARQYVMALQAGEPILLTGAEISAAGKRLTSHALLANACSAGPRTNGVCP